MRNTGGNSDGVTDAHEYSSSNCDGDFDFDKYCHQYRDQHAGEYGYGNGDCDYCGNTGMYSGQLLEHGCYHDQ